MDIEGPVPGGYDDKRPIGRPEETSSFINTQKDIANTQLQIARENKNKYDKKNNEKKKK
jgi:hypothetical protein